MGNRATGLTGFDGFIDDVRIYNRILSAADIRNLYNETQSKFNVTNTDALTKGLVGHWTFDGQDISGTRATDRSGNNNHGTITGAIAKPGKIGMALDFDGVDDFVDIGNPSVLQLTGAMAVSVWIRPDNTAAGKLVSKTGGDGNRGYDLRWGAAADSKVYFEVSSDGTNLFPVSTVNALSAGQWYHLVGVFEPGTAVRIYLNGRLDDSNTTGIPSSQFNSTLNVNIARRPTGATAFSDGSIDDVRIYNRALSAGEIQKLYNMGR